MPLGIHDVSQIILDVTIFILAGGSTVPVAYITELQSTAPFAFDLILRYLHDSPFTTSERIEGDTYRRPYVVGETVVLVEVTSQGPVDAPRLMVAVRGDGVAEAAVATVGSVSMSTQT